MSIFAISDIHLGTGVNKPMNIFGGHWDNHAEKIKYNWEKNITENDTVIIPGDISWGINTDEANPDFKFLDSLPGTKILSKGNHDYWWSTVNKIEKYFSENDYKTLKLLKNNSYLTDDKWIICGTRGWLLPCDVNFKSGDEKIFHRELGRLKISLDSCLPEVETSKGIIAVLHYPPLLSVCKDTEFTHLLEQYSVKNCVFGHIHKGGSEKCFEGVHCGIGYHNVSADKIGFNPLCIKP